MASTRGNFLKAREYFCILLSFLELSLVRQPPTRFICSSPFSVSKKKMPTKNLDWEYRETVGLFGCKLLFILALKIGTTSWKTPCIKKSEFSPRDKVLWGCSCSECALCLVPYLFLSQLLAEQRCWQVSQILENLHKSQNFRKIYINGKLNFEVTTKYLPEVGKEILTSNIQVVAHTLD